MEPSELARHVESSYYGTCQSNSVYGTLLHSDNSSRKVNAKLKLKKKKEFARLQSGRGNEIRVLPSPTNNRDMSEIRRREDWTRTAPSLFQWVDSSSENSSALLRTSVFYAGCFICSGRNLEIDSSNPNVDKMSTDRWRGIRRVSQLTRPPIRLPISVRFCLYNLRWGSEGRCCIESSSTCRCVEWLISFPSRSS